MELPASSEHRCGAPVPFAREYREFRQIPRRLEASREAAAKGQSLAERISCLGRNGNVSSAPEISQPFACRSILPLFPLLRPGHVHIDFAAAAFGAGPAARADRARVFRRRTEQPSRRDQAQPDAGRLHHTINRTPAAAAAPGVTGGPE
jgi:hypothetical protein